MITFGLLSTDPIETRVRDFVSVMRVPENLLSVQTYAESLAADIAAERVMPEYLDQVFRNLRTTEDELPTIAQVISMIRSEEYRAKFEQHVFDERRKARLNVVPRDEQDPAPAA